MGHAGSNAGVFICANTKGTNMATALQLAANRRNAKKSTGPRTAEGKKRASLNHVKHGMTAQTVILPHESADDYEEIREALIKDYAPATTQELMLVDQIAVGYWRTIRARKFEAAMFDNRLRTVKRKFEKDQSPNSGDDEGCAVILQVTDPEELKNYFRYDRDHLSRLLPRDSRSREDAGRPPPRRST